MLKHHFDLVLVNYASSIRPYLQEFDVMTLYSGLGLVINLLSLSSVSESQCEGIVSEEIVIMNGEGMSGALSIRFEVA